MTNKNVAKMPKKSSEKGGENCTENKRGKMQKNRPPPLPLSDRQSVACHWAGKNCHLSI